MLVRRRATLFRSVEEKVVKMGVIRSFTPDTSTDWEYFVDDGINVLNKIDYEDLMYTVFGADWLRHILSFMNVVG